MSTSNCSSCKKKYGIFKYNRTKCMECGQGYCLQCIRKANGLRLYCDICLILNDRPANRTRIMDIRSKEVKLYLARRKVSTEQCLEKEDLVNRFLSYVDTETRLPRRNNYLNGLMSNFRSSMPNLAEPTIRRNQNGSSSQSNRQPHVGQPSSSQSVPHTSPVNYPQPQQEQPQQETQNASATTSSTNSTAENKPVKKLIRLKDIQNVEDISNLTVRQLKELLFINRINITGCVEKEELVKKAVDLWVDSRAEETENLTTEDLCKICMDAPLNSVLLECGHIATCIDCGKQLAECPICRQYIVRVVHTFKA